MPPVLVLPVMPGEDTHSPGLRLLGLRGVTPPAGDTRCVSALVLGSVLVPIGLFPGAFNRRPAVVI